MLERHREQLHSTAQSDNQPGDYTCFCPSQERGFRASSKQPMLTSLCLSLTLVWLPTKSSENTPQSHKLDLWRQPELLEAESISIIIIILNLEVRIPLLEFFHGQQAHSLLPKMPAVSLEQLFSWECCMSSP